MNSHSVVGFIFLLLVCCPAYSSAAGVGPASLRELIIVGLQENIGLQVEQLNIPVSSEAIRINEAVFDPELFASAGFTLSKTPISSTLSSVDRSDSEQTTAQVGLRKKYYSGLSTSISLNSEWSEDNSQSDDLDPRYRSSVNLNLTQPLLRDFGLETNTTGLQLSRNQSRQASLLHLLQAQSLALQIEVLASQAAGEAEIVALHSEAVALAKDLYAANQRRFDAGVIPVSEVQEAETALANRELDQSVARQVRELHYEDLKRQLNHQLPVDFDISILYSFPADIRTQDLPDINHIFDAALDKNIRLQLGEFDIRNANIQQRFYQNQMKPRLDLNLQAGINGLSGDERSAAEGSQYAGSWGESFNRAAEADGYQWGAGLEFSLPLGNRSAKSRLRQAELQRKQSNYRQRDLQTELKSELQQQMVNLKRAFEQVKIAERFEQLSKLSLHQEQRRLDEGLSDTFRMILFQNNMINAKIGRINALIQYYIGVAQLSFTRGTILEQHNITLLQATEENSFETM